MQEVPSGNGREANHRIRTTEHRRTVAAPPAALYELVADVTRWPAVFGPTVHVQHLEHTGDRERFRIWAVLNGAVSNWTSRRVLDPVTRRIDFRQEVSRAPVASMGGSWEFLELPGGHTEVVLRHAFTAVDDDPEQAEWITRAVDRNSPSELGALARVAELGHPVDEVVFSFTDEVALTVGAAEAFAFVDRADRWAELLPHVDEVALEEPEPGVQRLEMVTRTADGATHRTASWRVRQEPEWIAYKQSTPPALLLGHSGLWTFGTDAQGRPVATARHTVAVDPAAVPAVLGPGSTLADARAHLREALGGNSLRTLSFAAGATNEAR
ncbi:SRPBCC family protein [Kitasatospora sp. NPDC059827]|uniref:aromatase/cyclase n=1 Tax=Kitasatospora sp. NPDC059827 TaxID=3346964 RepID=UPI003661070A